MNRSTRILALFASVWFIAAAAFLTRVAFIWHQQTVIPHEILAAVPFDQEAGNIAYSLSLGHGYSNLFRQPTGPTAWLAPVYPFLLSLIFRVFGAFTISSFFVAVLLNALLSAAVTFPLFDIAQRIGKPAAGVASAWLWVFLPAGIFMPFEWIWDTSLSVLLATTLVWATLRVADSAKALAWYTYGALWAVALLTNPSLGIALPFLLLWAAARAHQISKLGWRLPLASFAVIVLCCVPWTLHNYSQFHKVIPLRSNFAFELWLGNNSIFDPHAVGGIQRITRFEETRHYAQLGETAYLAEKWTLARTFIQQKPTLFLQLTGRKIIATWAGTEHPLDEFRRTDSQLARMVILTNLLLTLGTLTGIAILARAGSPFTFPVAVFPPLYPLVYYITHTSLRYRHPIDPLLIVLSVLSVSAALSGLRKPNAGRVA